MFRMQLYCIRLAVQLLANFNIEFFYPNSLDWFRSFVTQCVAFQTEPTLAAHTVEPPFGLDAGRIAAQIEIFHPGGLIAEILGASQYLTAETEFAYVSFPTVGTFDLEHEYFPPNG